MRGVGRKNADMELAQLADVLPAEDRSSNAAEPDLEPASAPTGLPGRAERSPPPQGPPPAASSHRQDASGSPKSLRSVMLHNHPAHLLQTFFSFEAKRAS